MTGPSLTRARNGPGARAAALLASLLASIVVASLPALAGAQEAPPPASFTYRVSRTVADGSGAYVGYSDSLEAAGRYELAPEGQSLRIDARYAWIYRGERCDEGVVERSVRVGLPERDYVGQTDLDDYDDQTDAALATWVWIPPSSPIGSSVRVLERDFQVTAAEPVTVAGRALTALRVATAGTGTRNDEYGSFETTFTDTYWFDAATGYFLRSEYVEQDVGSLDGAPAGFAWREVVEITAASYVPGTVEPALGVAACDPVLVAPGRATPDEGFAGCFLFCALLGLALFVGGLLHFAARFAGNHRPVLVAGLPVQVVPVTSPADVPALGPADSPNFAPFLRHFAECAVRAGDPVFVARLSDGRPVGLALADKEANIGSIFAKEPDACELLRRALGVTEFFTETRHEILPSVLGAAIDAKSTQRPLAYNVYETYDILELAPPIDVSYDAALVTRRSEADAKEVADLSAEVHGLRGERWLAAALATGDLGFVARLDGRLVGYAFVTVVGERARLHTNTVHPDFRGRGIGKELTRARLGACAALGVTRAITEVATWNVASLEVVRALGFQVVGQMWVESAAAARVERKVVRR